MIKIKAPKWESYKDYPKDYELWVCRLISFSDKDYQLRVWHRCEGPEVDWYDESFISFDNLIEFLKDDIRKGKPIYFNVEQMKALLRLHAMLSRFTDMDDPDFRKIVDGADKQLYIINHPYFAKIRTHAEYTLSLMHKVPTQPFRGFSLKYNL